MIGIYEGTAFILHFCDTFLYYWVVGNEFSYLKKMKLSSISKDILPNRKCKIIELIYISINI